MACSGLLSGRGGMRWWRWRSRRALVVVRLGVRLAARCIIGDNMSGIAFGSRHHTV